MDYDLTKRVLAALEREGVRYVVLGGRPKTSISSWLPSARISSGSRRQYVPPDGTFHVDIVTRLGELYDFDSLVSERIDFGGDAERIARRFKLNPKEP